MIYFNKKSETPNSDFDTEKEAPKLDSSLFRGSLRILAASALAFTISSCGEKPKETQNTQALSQDQLEQVQFRKEYDECVLKLKKLRPDLDSAWDKQNLAVHSKLLEEYNKIEKRRTDIYHYNLKRK